MATTPDGKFQCGNCGDELVVGMAEIKLAEDGDVEVCVTCATCDCEYYAYVEPEAFVEAA